METDEESGAGKTILRIKRKCIHSDTEMSNEALWFSKTGEHNAIMEFN